MKRTAWGLSVLLAVLGLVVLLTDWIGWPWWVGLLLGTPVGLMLLSLFGGEEFNDQIGSGSSGGGVGGGGWSNGGFGGDGGGDGGGGNGG